MGRCCRSWRGRRRLVRAQALPTTALVLDSTTSFVAADSKDGLDGVESADGKRCLHVWLTTSDAFVAERTDDDDDERPPAKVAKTTTTTTTPTSGESPRRRKVRPLPLLITECAKFSDFHDSSSSSSSSSNSSSGTRRRQFVASIVGEHVYHDDKMPSQGGVFSCFPSGGTEFVSDSPWDQLGYAKNAPP